MVMSGKSWRQATIIPVPKPGKHSENPQNYRLMALTSCLCKRFEKMVARRLSWHLEITNLLSNYQCGFRTKRSTAAHLIRLETLVREAFINNQPMVDVFFDLEKAYDTIWKYGKLKNLKNMGFEGNLPIGYKNETCVGAACHSSSADKCCGVSAKASIFTAEAVALCMALDNVSTLRKDKFLILSDSLSLVKAVTGQEYLRQDDETKWYSIESDLDILILLTLFY
ncbi:hypothetical protein EGW08_009672 [Elysia chlorotica]|uniref:Reverse transcriptase domain-containing protein n=1 Tax=Elysia chlorotica TaxID=188477 RepID=A0A433TLT4_ELYCH|nr:hypothetical protein EGW08_009672 [Elysia chlorotica]